MRSSLILLQLREREGLPVFLGRHPVRLAESSEKAGIILEAVSEADLADLLVHHDGIAAGGESFAQQVLVNGNAKVFLKGMGNMVFADEEMLGEAVKGTYFYAYSPYDGFKYQASDPLCLTTENSGSIYVEGQEQWSLPMVAKGDDNQLLFKQVSGVLGFQVAASFPIEIIQLRTNDGTETLAGPCVIDLSQLYYSRNLFILPPAEFHSLPR